MTPQRASSRDSPELSLYGTMRFPARFLGKRACAARVGCPFLVDTFTISEEAGQGGGMALRRCVLQYASAARVCASQIFQIRPRSLVPRSSGRSTSSGETVSGFLEDAAR
jgi:hypothetical protein